MVHNLDQISDIVSGHYLTKITDLVERFLSWVKDSNNLNGDRMASEAENYCEVQTSR